MSCHLTGYSYCSRVEGGKRMKDRFSISFSVSRQISVPRVSFCCFGDIVLQVVMTLANIVVLYSSFSAASDIIVHT